MSVRTFIAVEMDPSIRAAIAKLQQRLADPCPEVRWTAEQNLHLTVKFLGDVKEIDLPRVCTLAQQAADEVPPFSVAATGIGTFGSPGRTRIVWCGFTGAVEMLVRLHDRLDELLVPVGVPGERRRYTPHLTVGRARSRRGAHVPADVLEPYTGWSAGAQHVDHIVVFSSQLGPGGPRYDALAHCPLAGLRT